MPLNYDTHYAEVEKGDTLAVDGLFAGDAPAPATQDLPLTGPLQQFVPLQRTETGTLEPWAAGNEIAAITGYAVPAGTARAAVYVAGCFNLDALRWPADTTEAQVEAAQTGKIICRKLLYSDKRTGTEPAPGTPAGP